MKYIDEFRRKKQAQAIIERIRAMSCRKASVMEICGTHTHAMARYGIRAALADCVRLISGPGCPVCVTSAPDVDRIIAFGRDEKNSIIATFGDMMRVPGSQSSLERERATGADIRPLYSPLGALEIARENPAKEVVLFAVGFETTAPTVAATILNAKIEGIKNLSVLALHKLTPPAMKALLDSGETPIDGFIAPGHVTAIIGARSYEFLAKEYASPCVVAGFEPLDAIYGLYMLMQQIKEGRSEIENQYSRVVKWQGNMKAQEVIAEVFEPADASWRGIGVIPQSGLKIRREYSYFDAEARFDMPSSAAEEPTGCKCGGVLKGVLSPPECPLFAVSCTPESPAGPCMVSSEGTCAAYYKYRDAEAV